MKHECSKALILVGILGALSACGGGGGGTAGVMSASSNNLIGVNAQTGTNPRVIALLETDGTADAQSGLSADFDGYTFASGSGFENGAAIEDGNTIGLLNAIDLPTQTDLILFDGAFDPGTGAVAVYYGIVGDAPANSLPTSGTATWSGSGFADLISGSGTEELGIGQAAVTANFGGDVTAVLSGLSGTVDTVTLSGMAISGDRFQGSDVETSKSGGVVNVVGANGAGLAQGVFSGSQSSAGIPDEIGGLFSLTGDNATLVGGFIAD